MAKIGIACDNYKLAKFKAVLERENYAFTVSKLTEDTSTITLEAGVKDISNIHSICEEVTKYFKIKSN